MISFLEIRVSAEGDAEILFFIFHSQVPVSFSLGRTLLLYWVWFARETENNSQARSNFVQKNFIFAFDTQYTGLIIRIGLYIACQIISTLILVSDQPVRCPFCKEDDDKVIDSRSSEGGRAIRRRRQCLACKRRFTTYEKIGESFKLSVIKKDGSRIPYGREKVIAGLQKACYKRQVSADQIQELADKVEEDVFKKYDREVSSSFIGESVMRHLRAVDKVAYIRFASVYREFTDAGDFIDEVRQAIAEPYNPGHPELFTD